MNKRKKIIISCIVLIVAIMVCSIIIILLKNNENELEPISVDYQQIEEETKEYVEDKTIPQGISMFTNEYEGDVSRTEFYELLYTASRYLPVLSKELKEANEVEEYYEENFEDIKKNIGIDNIEDFIKLANYLMENDISDDKFEYCAYEENTMDNKSDYSIFKMKFTYTNYGELEFSVKLLNSESYNTASLVILVPQN